MTIEKGQPWGEPALLPPDSPIAHSDEALRAIVEEARRSGEPIPVIGLLGGDLHRTLGGTGGTEERLRTEAVAFPIDLGAALVDGRMHWFVAHLISRRRGWTDTFAAFNAQWYEKWNLAPRGHPNDGKLDVYEAKLPLSQMWRVARRARLGAHLPHPGITEQRTAAIQVEFATRRNVILDGTLVGQARNLSVRVEPDAFTVIV